VLNRSDSGKHGLIGHSGFVGSILKRQHRFHDLFRSTDVHTIAGQEYDLLVCAGAPAKKWLANQRPEEDRESIDKLIQALSTVRCNTFVLISTVDVFSDPVGVDESAVVGTEDLHPYGLHRYGLEEFVQHHFASRLILRLPGLVGPGLKKNIIYDFHNKNDLAKIDSRSVFQFYPMVNLWTDLQRAIGLGIDLLHLTAEPVSVRDVSEAGFGIPFENLVLERPPAYDFQTRFASSMGGQGRYTYSQRESLQAVRAYAQTEPLAQPGG